jgi:hypothetical protein
MRRILLIGLLTCLFSGCAAWHKRAGQIPSATDLIGTYGMGFGGICYEVTLRPDYSYSGLDCAGGHFGPSDGQDRHFSGQWKLENEILSFSSIGPLGDLDLSPAEIFFYNGSEAFVFLKFIDKGKALPYFVFTRIDSK